MLVLQANEIRKSYGTRTVLEFDRFLVYEGDKIGIVGDNGSGKTTLLNILSKEQLPDGGSVTCDWNIEYLHQFEERDTTRSGGENAKADIREKAGQEGRILFADEPTANLDTAGQEWVRKKLLSTSTLLLVSHDRSLLDEVCTRIVEIKDGNLTEYTGNYSDYEDAVRVKKQQQEQARSGYLHAKAHLESAVQKKERAVSRLKANKKAELKKNSSEARLRGDKRAAIFKQVERESSVLKARLERLEPVERVKELPGLRIDFTLTHPPGNKNVITCDRLTFSYGGKPVLEDVSFVIPNRTKTVISGKNGAGKSTLLRLIREEHPAIRRAPKMKIGFLYQNFENLKEDKTVLENALADSVQDLAAVRSVLAGLLFSGDTVYKPVSVLSGGEKMRLSLAKLLTGSANTLLLDEPTNYLDLRAVEAVQNMLADYPGTLLLVSHDERFVQAVAQERLHLENGAVSRQSVQAAEQASRNPVEKTLLEIRLTSLVGRISSAPPEKKALLEQEYAEVLQQLQHFR